MKEFKKKIAIVEPVGGHGGMNYYDYGLVDGLKKSDVSSYLYTCDKTIVPEPLKSNTFLFFKNIYGVRPKIIRFYSFLVGLFRSIRHAKVNRIKLVHYHFFQYSFPEIFQILMARFFRMKIAITAHDVESFATGSSLRIARYVYNNCDAIIVHNQISKDAVLPLIRNTSKKINVISHGDYLDFVSGAPSRDSARKKLDISRDQFTVLFFGQIKKVKGLDLLLEAWGNVGSLPAKPLLVVAGKIWKDDIETYEEIVNRKKIGDTVRFDTRYIPDEEALQYYAAADLIVLPYRKIYQSGVLLMAMSHRRAVLVSDLPGMTEIVKDGENGFVFRSGDSTDLARVLSDVINGERSIEPIAEAGYRTVQENHSWEKIGQATKQVYMSVLE